MAENTWLRNERQYFVDTECGTFNVIKKTLNAILEKYNKFLQKALLRESPFVAEDLKITMEKSGGNNAGPENS